MSTWYDVRFYIVYLFVLVLSVCALWAVDNRVNAWKCNGVHEVTGKETKFRAGQCFVLVGSVYVPLEYVYGTAVELRNVQQ